ncbi:MAG: response regulator [Magnetococcales bacterium]|nr:response regulator [Magnetococcales bacterium]MBF0322103.1 response regulator [Magnetococcales bacterium]
MPDPLADKKSILVVDDTPDNLTLVSGVLKDVYKVRVANSGDRGLKIARSEMPPDLILLDIMMPGMDGFEVMRQLQAVPDTKNIPVIFLTARSEVEDEERGLALGAVDYITKPISPPILLARVQTHLALKSARDQLQNQNHLLEEKVKERTRDLVISQSRLEKLVELGLALTQELDTNRLLEMILLGGKELTNADAATLYLCENESVVFAIRSRKDTLPMSSIPFRDPVTGQENHHYVSVHVALTGESVCLSDLYGECAPFDVSGVRQFDESTGYHTRSMLTVALKSRQGIPVGVLQLINSMDPVTGEVVPFHLDLIRLAEAMASQAGVALDNHHLIQDLEKLFDSVIKLVASAIDAKSHYTGGHCERVPELGRLLAEAACNAESGVFADFVMSPEEWKSFRMAGWLHDCGKVTTPEFVVDKATKLETLYNRIHEIRTRFEVLRRDYEIAALVQSHQPGADLQRIAMEKAAAMAELESDFAFVAGCNVGDAPMSPEMIARLERIAKRTWQRTFDDRLGLSHVEMDRIRDLPVQPLPVQESLLADKPSHIISRQEVPLSYDPDAWGIRLKVPEYLYNNGELYNLCIARGTLNEEERYKINEHVIYSIIMLSQLPFPKSMSNIVEYAGSHHETQNGKGYPRRLSREQQSVQARILAIADIFEALTASDRPYKKAKTLSEALNIMSFMVRDQHIDGDLFDLFLSSRVYQTYADKYLKPEQRDQVDLASFRRKS